MCIFRRHLQIELEPANPTLPTTDINISVQNIVSGEIKKKNIQHRVIWFEHVG